MKIGPFSFFYCLLLFAVGDGRPFWRFIVQEATQCSDEAMFEEVYQYYARPGAV
jgi:hypothetical protein